MSGLEEDPLESAMKTTRVACEESNAPDCSAGSTPNGCLMFHFMFSETIFLANAQA
jgi:hypothetical protein